MPPLPFWGGRGTPLHAAGEATATEKPQLCLGRGLELSPLQQIKNKKPKSFSPQLGSGGRGTFSKALHARRESEAHVHKPRLTAGCENEVNNPHHAPAAEATATQSLHRWAVDSSFERKGTGRYQSLILSQQRRLYKPTRTEQPWRKPRSAGRLGSRLVSSATSGPATENVLLKSKSNPCPSGGWSRCTPEGAGMTTQPDEFT